MRKIEMCGVRVSIGEREELFAVASGLIGKGGIITSANPEILAAASESDELSCALNESVCIPDGVGVKIGAKILGEETEVYPGVELAEDILDVKAVRLAVIGGREGIAERAMQELTVRHRSVIPEFALCGYAIDHAMVEDILRQRRPDVVFVCLGSPTQEIFISRMRHVSKKLCS